MKRRLLIITFVTLLTLTMVALQKPDTAKPHSFESSDSDTVTFVDAGPKLKCPRHGKVEWYEVVHVGKHQFHQQDVMEVLAEFLRERIPEVVEESK